MQELIIGMLLVAFGFLCGTIYMEASAKRYVKKVLENESLEAGEVFARQADMTITFKRK